MMRDLDNERKQLETEKAAIERRGEKRKREAERDGERRRQIDAALLRLDCIALLNIAEGVVVRHREPAGSRWAILNDSPGTLKEVRRTRGLVDFGTHGEVLIPLHGLLPAEKKSSQSRPFVFGALQ